MCQLCVHALKSGLSGQSVEMTVVLRHSKPNNNKRIGPILLVVGTVVVVLVVVFLIRSHRPPLNPIPYTRRNACPQIAPGRLADIVIYIPSPIPWRDRRTHVMRQMRHELDKDAHLYFVFGTREGARLELEERHLAAAQKEAAAEKDQRVRYLFTACRDIGDEINNANGTSSTTCKTYEALRFIARTYAAHPPRFVWRGADDAYLDLNVFRQFVAPKLQTCRLFFGKLEFPQPHNRPDLDLYSNQPELYALYGLKKLGKYMYGMGFCMSWDVVLFIAKASIPPHLTFPEDVIVSSWLLFHDIDWADVHDIDPDVGMHNMDYAPDLEWLQQRMVMMVPMPTYKLLVAHKLSAAQWLLLHQRPKGDLSYRFAFASANTAGGTSFF